MAKPKFPVYEFRPQFKAQFRYADGLWLVDDGNTYDLAFVDKLDYPRATYFSHHFRKAILWTWVKNGKWYVNVKKHPGGNAWHYMLRPGNKDLDAGWNICEHPNQIAKESAMSKCFELFGCANGRAVERQINDPYIAAGLVREVETKKILRFPKIFNCMYCGKIDWRKDEN